MEKQMVENNSNEPAVVNVFILQMPGLLKLSIDSMEVIVKELQDQGKTHEAEICSIFLLYMLGVYNLALEKRLYVLYPGQGLPPDIYDVITIDLIRDRVLRCSAMQKEYALHPEQGITVDYEQLLDKLKALEDLFKTELPDRTAMSNIIVELIYVTTQAYKQLMNDLSLKPKDPVTEEEAKPESVSDKQ